MTQVSHKIQPLDTVQVVIFGFEATESVNEVALHATAVLDALFDQIRPSRPSILPYIVDVSRSEAGKVAWIHATAHENL